MGQDDLGPVCESTALGGLLVFVSPLTPRRDSKATLVEEGRQGKRCSVGEDLEARPWLEGCSVGSG